MGYISNADVEQRMGPVAYVQLSDDAGSGTADESVVNEARLGAEGELNSYLAGRYAVPVDLAVHPELEAVVVSFVLDLVEYRLHGRRPPIPEGIVQKRTNAIEWLSRLSAGEVQLPGMTPIGANPAAGIEVEQSSNEQVFTRDEMRGV